MKKCALIASGDKTTIGVENQHAYWVRAENSISMQKPKFAGLIVRQNNAFDLREVRSMCPSRLKSDQHQVNGGQIGYQSFLNAESAVADYDTA
jgi:hypothetical protein